jgi:hypothetical protein
MLKIIFSVFLFLNQNRKNLKIRNIPLKAIAKKKKN